MRKKQANLYNITKKTLSPPYLNQQQLKDFKSQFTLFQKQLCIRKLKQTMQMHDYPNNYRPVYRFVQRLLQEKQKFTFQEYIEKMNQYFQSLDTGDLVMQMLADRDKDSNRGKTVIDKDVLKETLQETIGRQLVSSQIDSIMSQIDQADQDAISRSKVIQILQQYKKLRN